MRINKEVFKRVEKKYMLNHNQYFEFMNKIKNYVKEDKFSNYLICNIYFDTDNYDLIRSSIEKPVFKEKLRLRSYGVPQKDDLVFLEIKRKFKGTVYKRRISAKLKDVLEYINNGNDEKIIKGQIFKEIDYFMKLYKPKPKFYLSYERFAFIGNEDENLRITVDKNIQYRTFDLNLSLGSYGEGLIDKNKYLIEIKTGSSLPIWLVNILSELEIYSKSFSKYGNAYKEKIKGNMEGKKCLQIS